MKYDWQALKRRYTFSKKYGGVSLREFARCERIPFSGHFIQKTKLWHKEKEEKRIQMGYETDTILSEKAIREAVLLNGRHTKLYNRFLDILEKACNETEQDGDLHTMQSNLRVIQEAARIVQNGKSIFLENKD